MPHIVHSSKVCGYCYGSGYATSLKIRFEFIVALVILNVLNQWVIKYSYSNRGHAFLFTYIPLLFFFLNKKAVSDWEGLGLSDLGLGGSNSVANQRAASASMQS